MDLSHADSVEREDRLNAILLAYVEAVESGQRPDREALLRRHPEFAAELTEFFAGEARLDNWAEPLHPLLPAPPSDNGKSTETVSSNSIGGSVSALPLSGAFGEYDLLEEIGRGGMGVIYKVRHHTLNRVAALKTILGGQFASPAEKQRFQDEAEAVAALDHPHIVPIYRIGEFQGQAYFTMKLIEGGSLAAGLAGGTLPGQSRPTSPVEALVGPTDSDGRARGPSRPPARHPAPRPQTGQHPPRFPGAAPCQRFWAGQARRRYHQPDRNGHDCGHPGLHGARASRGPQAGVDLDRCVQPGGHPLRTAHGTPAVPGTGAVDCPPPNHGMRARPSALRQRPSRCRPGDGLPEVPAQGAGTPL